RAGRTGNSRSVDRWGHLIQHSSEATGECIRIVNNQLVYVHPNGIVDFGAGIAHDHDGKTRRDPFPADEIEKVQRLKGIHRFVDMEESSSNLDKQAWLVLRSRNSIINRSIRG